MQHITSKYVCMDGHLFLKVKIVSVAFGDPGKCNTGASISTGLVTVNTSLVRYQLSENVTGYP